MDSILKQLVVESLAKMEGKQKTEKVSRGTVSPQLLQRFKEWDHAMDDLKKEVERALEDAEDKVKRGYEPKYDQLKQVGKAVWQEVYKELGIIDIDNKFSIAMGSGEIEEHVPIGKDKDDDGMFDFRKFMQ